MFTVEDVNSVVLEDKVNGYHVVDTSLRGSRGVVVVDFVKVRKVSGGFSFEVVSSLWTGGFYLTKLNGDYISLSSNDYSFTGGVLSVTTGESDVVLVLYLSSFYSSFNLQYLNCRLESLCSVVDAVSVGTDDFSSLNGTVISSGDISVSGGVVTCRSNTFYKGIRELMDIPKIEIETAAYPTDLFAGGKHQMITLYHLIEGEDSLDILVTYKQEEYPLHFDEEHELVSFYVDLRDHLTNTPITLKVTGDEWEYYLKVPVRYYGTDPTDSISTALAQEIPIISPQLEWGITSLTTIDYNVTFKDGYLLFGGNGRFLVKPDCKITIDNMSLMFDSDCNYPFFILDENTETNIQNTRFGDVTGYNPNIHNGFIMANEDITNLNSTLNITGCTFRRCEAPNIVFDGTLNITDTTFTCTTGGNGNVMEPAFIHLVNGEANIEDTSFAYYGGEGVVVEGYNICNLLLGEDTRFNKIPSEEVSKNKPSLNQYGITSEINTDYQNGEDTIHLTDGFYVAVEDKKIKNIKEDD